MTSRVELIPHPDTNGAYLLTWNRDFCELDLQDLNVEPPDQIPALVDRYFAEFRLTLDERGGGFVDSVGDWYALPSGVARMVTLNMGGPAHGIPGYVHSDQLKTLVFLDASGHVLLRIPNYGWNIPDLEQWAHEQDLDTEITSQTFGGDALARERAFPGFRNAPSAPIGKPFFTPKPFVPLGTRLKRKLGLA